MEADWLWWLVARIFEFVEFTELFKVSVRLVELLSWEASEDVEPEVKRVLEIFKIDMIQHK